MAKQQGIDDIIKGAGKLIGKATKAAKKGAKKTAKATSTGKKPPQPPKRPTGGKPPAVGSKPTSTRGGMTSKELDSYRKKTYSDSRNYFENSAKYQKDIKAAAKKNQLKKRGDYK